MSPIDPELARNQRQVIDLLSQHKLEWRSLYGIQELSLFGSLARNEAIPGSDVDLCVNLEHPNPSLWFTFRRPYSNCWVCAWTW
jgi:predicted nucleotidyltransferase